MDLIRAMDAHFEGLRGLAELGGLIDPLTEAASFSARVRSVRAGRFVVAYMAATPCRLTRAGVGSGTLQMYFPFDTPLVVEGSPSGAVEPGGMLVKGADTEVGLGFNAPGRLMMISITGAKTPLGIALPLGTRPLLAPSTPSLAMLRAAADVLFGSKGPDRSAADLFARICRAALADACVKAFSDDARSSLFARAQSIIDIGFRDADLTPETLAASLGVSLRVLQRAYEDWGGISRAVRAHRVQEAIRILETEKTGILKFEDVARRSGFSNARTMRNAIMNSTGMRPRQIRNLIG